MEYVKNAIENINSGLQAAFKLFQEFPGYACPPEKSTDGWYDTRVQLKASYSIQQATKLNVELKEIVYILFQEMLYEISSVDYPYIARLELRYNEMLLRDDPEFLDKQFNLKLMVTIRKPDRPVRGRYHG